jgi:hypothetical protein
MPTETPQEPITAPISAANGWGKERLHRWAEAGHQLSGRSNLIQHPLVIAFGTPVRLLCRRSFGIAVIVIVVVGLLADGFMLYVLLKWLRE